MGLSNWLYAILLGSIMYFSSSCFETRAPLTMEIFNGVGEFFSYALPSAAMVWYFTILCAFQLLNATTLFFIFEKLFLSVAA